MALFDIYSKCKKRSEGKTPDVYQYVELPEQFRVQVVHILLDTFQNIESLAHSILGENLYKIIHDTLAREYGKFRLNSENEDLKSILDFLLESELDQALDTIEFSFRLVEHVASECHKQRRMMMTSAVGDAVFELNERFNEHGIGYQYEAGKIVRRDSEFLHKETVRETLYLLQDRRFAGAQTEFQDAHQKYRHQQYEDAISGSCKALESTLKIICKLKRWPFDEKDTATKLIDIVFNRGLIPKYLQSEFNSLASVLKSGVPTVRNREGGHGRGDRPRNVPAYLAAYVLHLTASTILFLVEASRN
ncbi:MAG: hypothetical protein OXD43_03070 [Bacteroidetes bacterium]|nr:hypothetical protein [Bacteroidota bacterium]